ncbi:hypothetical protein NV226_02740 [Mycoplasma iguanae]|uniref:Uncharacterized protein n=1 Tax=Mycoplasma iguanae TaxID=292461 RepID=A0ABY5R8W8_9MOLU|nr:hypothetical protein [Mycoplasma iguanae]UVD81617.1 hypothetical protein NV226_02740 [Mycoplasma iguanae]
MINKFNTLNLEPEKLQLTFDIFEKNVEGKPLIIGESQDKQITYYFTIEPQKNKDDARIFTEIAFYFKNDEKKIPHFIKDWNLHYVKTSDLEMLRERLDLLYWEDFKDGETNKKYVIEKLLKLLNIENLTIALIKVFYWHHPKYQFKAFVNYLPKIQIFENLDVNSLEEVNCYFREKIDLTTIENQTNFQKIKKDIESIK